MRIWIDTDLGSDVDDALTLAYVMRHPGFELVGVSTVFGDVALRSEIARSLLGEYGFSDDQFGCLDALWVSESDWRIDADNPSSAYGIPQALTETHDLPADYMTNAETQIRWGLGYIADSYGSPCSAWSFKQGNGWY